MVPESYQRVRACHITWMQSYHAFLFNAVSIHMLVYDMPWDNSQQQKKKVLALRASCIPTQCRPKTPGPAATAINLGLEHWQSAVHHVCPGVKQVLSCLVKIAKKLAASVVLSVTGHGLSSPAKGQSYGTHTEDVGVQPHYRRNAHSQTNAAGEKW